MKKKSDLQKKLVEKKELKQWVFMDSIRSKTIVAEAAVLLTKDKTLQAQLVEYHKDLLDRRFSSTITIYDDNNQKGSEISLHGLDPQILVLLEEYIRFTIQNWGYVNEHILKEWLDKQKVSIESIKVKNYLEKFTDIGNITFNVEFY